MSLIQDYLTRKLETGHYNKNRIKRNNKQEQTRQRRVIISMYLPDNLALNLNKILYANNRHLASFSRGTGLCVFSTIRNDNNVHVGVVFFSHAMSSHERIHLNVRLSTNTYLSPPSTKHLTLSLLTNHSRFIHLRCHDCVSWWCWGHSRINRNECEGDVTCICSQSPVTHNFLNNIYAFRLNC